MDCENDNSGDSNVDNGNVRGHLDDFEIWSNNYFKELYAQGTWVPLGHTRENTLGQKPGTVMSEHNNVKVEGNRNVQGYSDNLDENQDSLFKDFYGEDKKKSTGENTLSRVPEEVVSEQKLAGDIEKKHKGNSFTTKIPLPGTRPTVSEPEARKQDLIARDKPFRPTTIGTLLRGGLGIDLTNHDPQGVCQIKLAAFAAPMIQPVSAMEKRTVSGQLADLLKKLEKDPDWKLSTGICKSSLNFISEHCWAQSCLSWQASLLFQHYWNTKMTRAEIDETMRAQSKKTRIVDKGAKAAKKGKETQVKKKVAADNISKTQKQATLLSLWTRPQLTANEEMVEENKATDSGDKEEEEEEELNKNEEETVKDTDISAPAANVNANEQAGTTVKTRILGPPASSWKLKTVNPLRCVIVRNVHMQAIIPGFADKKNSIISKVNNCVVAKRMFDDLNKAKVDDLVRYEGSTHISHFLFNPWLPVFLALRDLRSEGNPSMAEANVDASLEERESSETKVENMSEQLLHRFVETTLILFSLLHGGADSLRSTPSRTGGSTQIGSFTCSILDDGYIYVARGKEDTDVNRFGRTPVIRFEAKRMGEDNREGGNPAAPQVFAELLSAAAMNRNHGNVKHGIIENDILVHNPGTIECSPFHDAFVIQVRHYTLTIHTARFPSGYLQWVTGDDIRNHEKATCKERYAIIHKESMPYNLLDGNQRQQALLDILTLLHAINPHFARKGELYVARMFDSLWKFDFWDFK